MAERSLVLKPWEVRALDLGGGGVSVSEIPVAVWDLMQGQSWRLERISPSTYTPDLGDPGSPPGNRYSQMFRARVGRGRWHYAPSLEAACASALSEVSR